MFLLIIPREKESEVTGRRDGLEPIKLKSLVAFAPCHLTFILATQQHSQRNPTSGV